MPAFEFALLDDSIAVLQINQVEAKVNLLSTAIWGEFNQALDELLATPDVQGLIIQSTKPGIFLAGAGLKELALAKLDDTSPTRAYLEFGLQVLHKLESLPYPTVAVIDGVCLGGGLEVALACDFRIAGTHPKCCFGFPEMKLGLIPGWGGTQRLARIAGPLNAIAWIAEAGRYSSEEAKDIGVLLNIVASEQLLEAASEEILTSLQTHSWQLERDLKSKPRTEEFLQNEEGLDELRKTILSIPGVEFTDSLAFDVALEVIFLGSSLPIEKAIQVETEGFLLLAGSEESKAKIEEFFFPHPS